MMRRAIVIGLMMTTVLTVSGCTTTKQQERKQRLSDLREQVMQSIREQEKSREQERMKQEAEVSEWTHRNRTYLLNLCDTRPGSEHVRAWNEYHIAVSSDSERAAQAIGTYKRVIDCEKLRNDPTPSPAPHGTGEPTSSSLPTDHSHRLSEWSSQRYLSGFTWSNFHREVIS